MTSAPVDQMVMVVHMYIVHKFQTKSDGSLPFFVLLMITTQVLYSATDPSNRVHQGTYVSKLIQSHYHIAPNLPLS